MFHNCSFTLMLWYHSRCGTDITYLTWLTHLCTINTLCWFTTDSPSHKLPMYDYFLSHVSLFVVPHRNLHSSRCLGIHHGLYGIGHVSASSIGIRAPHFCNVSLTFAEVHMCHGLLWRLAASHQVSAGLRFSHHLQFLHFPHICSV